jgi:hypothetical protein
MKYAHNIEIERITAATGSKIGAFLDEFALTFKSFDRNLIFGADETMIDTHRVHEHITSNSAYTIERVDMNLPNISVVLAHSCGGARVPPFVIVPKLITLRRFINRFTSREGLILFPWRDTA